MYKVPVFPTAYLPPIIYFTGLLNYKEIMIEACETFPRQTWRNRCSIASAQGKLDLIIPVRKPNGNHTETGEIIIDYSQKWQNNHWRAIESAYNKSPYFLYCSDALKDLIYSNTESLLDFNSNLLRFFLNFFKLSKNISYTRSYAPADPDHDLRKRLDPKGKMIFSKEDFPVYYQVFSDRLPFLPNLSILDLAVNEGPYGVEYLEKITSHPYL